MTPKDRQDAEAAAAERVVLATCMVAPSAFLEASQALKAEHFRVHAHRRLWAALGALAGQGKPLDDPRLVIAALPKPETGDGLMVAELLSEAVRGTNVRWHVERVIGFATLRELGGGLSDVAKRADAAVDAEADALAAEAEAVLMRLRAGTTRPEIVGPAQLADRGHALVEALQSGQGVMGVSTGLRDLDRDLRGLHPGQLVIVGGRPAMGKSSLAYAMAVAGTQTTGKAALFLSLEMGADEVILRHLTMNAQVDHWRLTNGKLTSIESQRVLSALNDLRASGLHVVDLPAASVGQVLALSRQVARGDAGLSVIVVDYLQLMSQDGKKKGREENRNQELGAITLAMKHLARELQVPVVLLSQLSRAVEARADKRPMLSDLRESGEIEAHADVVILVYRPAYYFDGKFPAHLAELIIAKHRNGRTGVVQAAFQGERMTFADWTDRVEGVA